MIPSSASSESCFLLPENKTKHLTEQVHQFLPRLVQYIFRQRALNVSQKFAATHVNKIRFNTKFITHFFYLFSNFDEI